MGIRLDIKKLLGIRSERVKSVEFHPSEPWILASLYSGQVVVWNYETQGTVKTFEVCDAPVRTSKWIIRKNWVVVGSDDMQIRVFNYNTHEKIANLEAHSDYIRSLAVHPTRPFVLSSSDDMTIKLWDWDQNWKNTMVFEGHSHYVMMVVFNPKDPNTFASASLDRTIKVWNLGSTTPNYTLNGHEKGVNCVEYYHGGDKPYLVSGADDKLVKIWDYQNKSCVQTLTAHTNNVSAVCFHPELPIIVSAAEDGTVRIWHANTYRLENTLNYGFERAWALCYVKGSNHVGFGFDEGTVVIKLGREDPSVSMDNSGKIIWSRHNEILTANARSAMDGSEVKDGEKIVLPTKDLGNSEVYPQSLSHSPNGRFVVVCGDGEYIIYTALAWRNKSYGSALEFVWASDSNDYAVRESTSRVKTFKNFKEANVIKTSFSSDGIFGGTLLGIRSGGFLCFYDWESGALVRRIDVSARAVYWSDNNEYVAIVTDESFYTLRYSAGAFNQAIESGENIPEDGVEAAFEFLSETADSVKTALWVGACFIFTNALNRLNYLVGSEVTLLTQSDNPLYLLGYLTKDSRIYLVDKDVNLFSYSLPLSVIDYQTAILNQDMETASRILPSIPSDQRNRVARFLESQDMKEEAITISTDGEHRFDLAIQLKKLDVAFQIASEQDGSNDHKWRLLSELAMNEWKFDFAEKCMWKGNDINSLFLLYQATGNPKGLLQVAASAKEQGKVNLVFSCLLLCNELEACLELLIESNRIPEAVFFAQSYLPKKVPMVVSQWRSSLMKTNKRVAEAILGPGENPESFPDFERSLEAESWLSQFKFHTMSAANIHAWKEMSQVNLLDSPFQHQAAKSRSANASPNPMQQTKMVASSPVSNIGASASNANSAIGANVSNANSIIGASASNTNSAIGSSASNANSAIGASASQKSNISKNTSLSPNGKPQNHLDEVDVDLDVDGIDLDGLELGDDGVVGENLQLDDDELNDLLK